MAGTLAVIGLIGNTEKIEAATDFPKKPIQIIVL